MGTNYYARILPTLEEKENLKKLIDSDDFYAIEKEVQRLYGESTEYDKGAEIHLGKRSGGWKFLFNPNYERYYPLTKEGLINFLKRDDVIIYTEYFSFREDDEYSKRKYVDTDNPDYHPGEYFWTAEQFMDMATNWGYNDPTAWDGKAYEKYEKERNSSYNGYERYGDKEREEFWIERGYNPSYYEFYNDGLRWSTCCEFS